MGEFYERHVGVTKIAVKKSLGKLRLTGIQLQRILTEIKATLNLRPLIYLTDGINDHVIITPMYFFFSQHKEGLTTSWKQG